MNYTTKKVLAFMLILFCFNGINLASNVKIDKSPVFVGTDTVNKTTNIQFDMSWENSWRNDRNYDAVWIFVKYKIPGQNTWKHLQLPANAEDFSIEIDNGISGVFSIGKSGDNVSGVFAFRKHKGTGNIKWNNINIKWKYGKNGIKNIDNIILKVFAIEMVYIPQGAFKVGSGGSESSAFFTYPDLSKPFAINSEDVITTGTKNGNLSYAKVNYAEPYYGEIPAVFPKGFKAFYCMKYELTQGQYVDFLNSLSRKQQLTRVYTDISAASILNSYVMSNTATISFRNGIRCKISLTESIPVIFYCDLNGNNIPNEKSDGQNIACNFLSWTDDGAFSDWAALRPMTELEYEKACRGTSEPVANEFAWGNTTIFAISDITNKGLQTETALNNTANCCCDNPVAILGPIKVGCFEKEASREQNGCSFYGIFDLSGNLFERCITVSNQTGLTFNGTHGDGEIDEWGYHDIASWPQFNGIGAGFRGGSFYYGSVFCRVSDRQYAALGDFQRYNHYGYRAVRTAE